MNSIGFPNLGIVFENVSRGFSIFGFHIAFYGLLVGIAILMGFVIAPWDARQMGQDPDIYMNMGIVGVIVSIICTRLYYVIFSWENYRHNLLSIFNLREGGLAVYGGIIGAALTIVLYSRWKKYNARQIYDTIALCLLNGQMIGRWGNFFNREAFGEYTNNLLAMRLPLEQVSSRHVTPLMIEHVEVIEGISFIQVHPTFLYESLWCAALLIGLLFYRKRKKFEGEVFLLYIFGYGLGRFWIEGLRTDPLFLPFAQLRVSQMLAGATVLVTGALILYWRRKHKCINRNTM